MGGALQVLLPFVFVILKPNHEQPYRRRILWDLSEHQYFVFVQY
jgi:hypothetical protein